MKDRKHLAKHFKDLGFKVGAEIGVLGGTYSIILCEANPELKLYCIDSWGLDEIRYRNYHKRKFEEAKNRLSSYNCTLIRNKSLEVAREFNELLDFVYIDANHNFDFVIQDIIQWRKKVRKDGIMAGDDYQKEGVKDAVDAYVKNHGLKLKLTRDNNWYFKI
jgi:predicted O-methyltransferase YrrM